MRIAVTGSIATDHLMSFDGRFSDSLVVEQLSKVSLSFLVDNLQIRRGGVAANIAFGLANLGLNPLLVGAVGQDFADYRHWLERHGVDCAGVHTVELLHTARFVCTTDRDQAQIASFYAGAMAGARQIELGPLGGDQPLDLVVISPNDPAAMSRHTQECRQSGMAFAADPSQQLAWSDGPQIQDLVDGAAYLFANDYESALIERKTGWDGDEILRRVGIRVVTHGADGIQIDGRGIEPVRVPAVRTDQVVDPTGVGDGFRAGFLAALAWGLDLPRCAQVGATLATLVLETVGPQEYVLSRAGFLNRLAAGYGDDAAAAVAEHLAVPV